MKEATIRRRLLEECRRRRLFAFPIETGMVYGGIPDLCITGRKTVWVELKWITRWPVRDTTPVKRGLLRPAQVNWMREYVEKGGVDAWIFVRVFDTYFLIHSALAEGVNGWVKEDYGQLAALSCPVRGCSWDVVFKELKV